MTRIIVREHLIGETLTGAVTLADGARLTDCHIIGVGRDESKQAIVTVTGSGVVIEGGNIDGSAGGFPGVRQMGGAERLTVRGVHMHHMQGDYLTVHDAEIVGCAMDEPYRLPDSSIHGDVVVCYETDCRVVVQDCTVGLTGPDGTTMNNFLRLDPRTISVPGIVEITGNTITRASGDALAFHVLAGFIGDVTIRDNIIGGRGLYPLAPHAKATVRWGGNTTPDGQPIPAPDGTQAITSDAETIATLRAERDALQAKIDAARSALE